MIDLNTPAFKHVSLTEAKKLFDFGTNIMTYNPNDKRPVRLYENHAELVNLSLEPDESLCGIIVNGNLTIQGNITNFIIDKYGSFLLVNGCLKAKNVINSNSDIWIKGDAEVTNTILGNLDTGCITIDGNAKAKVIISLDHIIQLCSQVDAITISVWNLFMDKEPDFSVKKGNICDPFIDEVFYADFDSLCRYIEEEKEFLKEEVLRKYQK